ncbi:MAG: cobalamin B12-binding domain-containing protein [Pseudomonadota bacterium]
MQRKVRVLIGKPGLDGHDRGAKLISRVLADAGVEVIYTGKFQTPEQIVGAAIQEDVDGIGLSILSGSHMTMFKKVIDLLKEKKGENIVVFGGGVIMPHDIEALEKMGVDKIFPPDSQTSQIVEYVKNIPSRRNS